MRSSRARHRMAAMVLSRNAQTALTPQSLGTPWARTPAAASCVGPAEGARGARRDSESGGSS
jgi:hypothetical protein